MRGALVFAALLSMACASGSPSVPPQDEGDAAEPGGREPAEPIEVVEEEPDGEPFPVGDGGTPVVGTSSDRSVTIRRTDGSPECDGLLPSAVPAPVQVEVHSNSLQCGRATSEGGGHVAVHSASGQGWFEWQVFSSEGQRERTFYLGSDVLLPQPDGWHGPRVQDRGTSYESVEVHTFFGSGEPRWHERATPPSDRVITQQWDLVENPLGGSLFLFSGQGKMRHGSCAGEARWFDAVGMPSGSVGSMGCWLVGGAVSIRGEGLIVQSTQRRGGTSYVHWIRRDGSHVRGPTSEGDADAIFSRTGLIDFAPLLDGSVVVNDQGRWTRRYPYLAESGESAPGWLASHPRWTFRFTRDNRGYAMFPPPGGTSGPCNPRIEIRAPSGRLCGTIVLNGNGSSCSLGYIDQGWDGTVVQQIAEGKCSYRWWPRLLAGD